MVVVQTSEKKYVEYLNKVPNYVPLIMNIYCYRT